MVKNRNRKNINVLVKTGQSNIRVFSYFTISEVETALERTYIKHNAPLNALSKSLKSKDSYTAYLCLNTWCALFEDITSHPGSILADQIRLNGIDATINLAEKSRLSLLQSTCDSSDMNSWNIRFDEMSPFWQDALSELDWQKPETAVQEALTVTGFPRRLRIEGNAENTERPELKAFLNGNDKMRRFNNGIYCWGNGKISIDDWNEQHITTPKYLLDGAREVINYLFSSWKQDKSLFTLPPGATFEGHKTYFEKWHQLIENQQWLRDHGVNFPWIPTAEVSDPADCCRWSVVPKNYKTGRNVAPEPVAKQVLGYQVDSGMRQCLRKCGFDLNDQSINQDACLHAFHNGYATIDWSAASDSISLWLVREIFKDLPELLSQLEACRSSVVLIPTEQKGRNRKITNFRFATMGNAITFSMETAIFIAVACVAIDMWQRLEYGKVRSMKWILNHILMYGDDTLVPNGAVPYLLTIAPMFGLTLNSEKSYWGNQLYRESCGVEGFGDFNVTGTYWPRGLSTQAYPELISLQHKLYMYPLTNRFLTSCILDVFPKVTCSEPNSEYMDLWVANCIKTESSTLSPRGCFGYLTLVPTENLNVVLKEAGVSEKVRNELLDLKPKASGLALKGKDDHRMKTMLYTLDEKLVRMLQYRYPGSFHILRRLCINLPSNPARDDNYELHTTVRSRSGNVSKMYAQNRREVDCLAYYMTIGHGIEHVNSSVYTKEENKVINRLDLMGNREIYIENVDYLK